METQTKELNTPPPNFFKNPRAFLILITSLVLIVVLISLKSIPFLNVKTPSKSLPKPSLGPKAPSPFISSNKVIAKVGEELIYQKDLETEILYYPPVKNFDKSYLLKKIVKDSIILQAAKADGFISLNTTTYNSLTKDYLKRIKLVEEAKKIINNQADGIEGTAVFMWFINGPVGPLGYEKSKEIVYAKILRLHTLVKNKEMTIRQAGEQIKNDTSLAQIDPAYKTNAILDFKALKGERITINEDFDKALWKLQKQEVSDVFVGKARNQGTGKDVEAFYSFGEVTKRITSGKVTSFDNWFAKKEKEYAVKFY